MKTVHYKNINKNYEIYSMKHPTNIIPITLTCLNTLNTSHIFYFSSSTSHVYFISLNIATYVTMKRNTHAIKKKPSHKKFQYN